MGILVRLRGTSVYVYKVESVTEYIEEDNYMAGVDRWTEFDKWCDKIIDNYKKNIEEINEFRRVIKSDDETFDKQIRHYEAGIKYYELRKEHYLETGDSHGTNVPEIKKAWMEMINRGYEYDPYSICIIMNNSNKEKKNDSLCITKED